MRLLLVLVLGLCGGVVAGPAQAAVKPPTGLGAGPTTASSVSLHWTAVRSAVAYRVKFSTSPTWDAPGYLLTTTRTATLTGLEPATTYYVKVRVVSARNRARSAYGRTIRVSTDPRPVIPSVAHPLRVGSYNVRCASCYQAQPDEGTWEQRRDAVVATIRGQDLDVLGVQEASQGWLSDANGTKFSLSQFEDLAHRLGGGWRLVNGKRNNCVRDTTPTGCVYADQGASLGTRILYDSNRVGLRHSGSAILPETDPKGPRHYVAWAELQQLSTGAVFVLADTHLTDGAAAYQLRMDQARVALATVEAHNPDHRPMISVGDWNSTRFAKPTNAPYDVWVGAGFVDPLGGAYRSTGRAAPGATVEHRIDTTLTSFNGFDRHARSRPGSVNGSYIDYILTTPMRVSEWQTVADLDANGDFVGQIPSDHDLVRATVWLPA